MSSRTVLAGAVGAMAGLALDRILGEPPDAVHPVALAGAGLTRLERLTYGDRRRNGVAQVAVAVAVATVTGIRLDRTLGRAAGTALSVWVAAAPTMLGRLARNVGSALEDGDLPRARQEVGALVGRAVDQLDDAGVARAAVESVAENTVDAATATVFWAAVGGSPAVLVHRVVNTLDAMVGHRDDRYRRFGWAAARLDDTLNWIPARLTALAVAGLAAVGGLPDRDPVPVGEVLRVVRRDSGRHPSPNGGVVEAAFAAGLGRSLGGVNRYGDLVEDRGRLGDGPPAGPETIGPAVTLLHRAAWMLAGAMAFVGLVANLPLLGPSRSPGGFLGRRG